MSSWVCNCVFPFPLRPGLPSSIPARIADGVVTAEFDFRVVGDGRSAVARYANNSNYRNDSLIRKESTLSLPPPPFALNHDTCLPFNVYAHARVRAHARLECRC